MKIEIEPVDVPLREFSDLQRELVEQGNTFDENTLRALSYSQLNLSCIGNAGTAACSPELVKREKVNRRERFLNLERDEFKEAVTYLKIEQMYGDVMYDIARRVTPRCSSLSAGQLLWARLTCLYNHVDNPHPRIQLALEAFTRCSQDPTCCLPVEVCGVYAAKLKGMATVYPGVVDHRISDETFRNKVLEMTNTLLEFMPDAERKLVEKEQLQDFACTSDCFKVLV